jgi:hypothetical protein
MHVNTTFIKTEQLHALACLFMNAYRRAEERQFNQGKDDDSLKMEQDWNCPVAAAYNANNEACPYGCSRLIQNVFEIFRK